ncbi:MAG: hypothetical protein CSYNP_01901 [Syntrophus sp. SKADARSKE-3]|nr:hypothetical protein [Syntrophus sp. SKADARSKE-3]
MKKIVKSEDRASKDKREHESLGEKAISECYESTIVTTVTF